MSSRLARPPPLRVSRMDDTTQSAEPGSTPIPDGESTPFGVDGGDDRDRTEDEPRESSESDTQTRTTSEDCETGRERSASLATLQEDPAATAHELSSTGISAARATVAENAPAATPLVTPPTIPKEEVSTPTHSPSALVIYLEPRDEGAFQTRRLQFRPQQIIKVGRSVGKPKPAEDNAMFDSKVLSRAHAELWIEDARLFVRDTKSSNGTFVNGRRLAESLKVSEAVELTTSDEFQFGVDVVESTQNVTHHAVRGRVVVEEDGVVRRKPVRKSVGGKEVVSVRDTEIAVRNAGGTYSISSSVGGHSASGGGITGASKTGSLYKKDKGGRSVSMMVSASSSGSGGGAGGGSSGGVLGDRVVMVPDDAHVAIAALAEAYAVSRELAVTLARLSDIVGEYESAGEPPVLVAGNEAKMIDSLRRLERQVDFYRARGEHHFRRDREALVEASTDTSNSNNPPHQHSNNNPNNSHSHNQSHESKPESDTDERVALLTENYRLKESIVLLEDERYLCESNLKSNMQELSEKRTATAAALNECTKSRNGLRKELEEVGRLKISCHVETQTDEGEKEIREAQAAQEKAKAEGEAREKAMGEREEVLKEQVKGLQGELEGVGETVRGLEKDVAGHKEEEERLRLRLEEMEKAVAEETVRVHLELTSTIEGAEQKVKQVRDALDEARTAHEKALVDAAQAHARDTQAHESALAEQESLLRTERENSSSQSSAELDEAHRTISELNKKMSRMQMIFLALLLPCALAMLWSFF